MYALVTYKNKEDQMKNEHARVVKTIQFNFRRPRAAYSVVGGQLW